MKKIIFLTLALLCCALPLQAVADKKESFNDFIKDKVYQKGYFSFYHDKNNGKVFLELSTFEQAFIFQSSLPKGIGSNDIGLDRGQLGNTRLVQFEKAGDKVFLRELNSYYRANTDNVLEKEAVEEAFASSILWGFKVVSKTQDNKKVLIDYTPFLLSDIHNLSASLKRSKQGSFSIDTSRSALYEKRTKSFPSNTELEATVTFTGSGAGNYLKSVTPDASAVTVNLHHSLIKLPDNDYKPRVFHPFSGYWSNEYADYSSAIDESLIKRDIPRHRLNKKDPTAILSEAVEPIIYYLDAGVPEPIRSALLEGARWWNQAFTEIGYKDAFQVKMLPSDADPMDVRYNVIQWVHRATRGWSYGSSVIDPRTGEIIKGHVTLGSLRVRQDYLIALGLTSPFKSENTDTSDMKAMALARIRQLSAHEVGHTLGIAHNFAASVNNRASVMDYPHPYIELKNGEIDLSNAYAENIGVWDKYVIAYGYSDIAQKDESSYLANLIKETKEQGLGYVSDADARSKSSAHSTGHLWDNGENASDELLRVLKVRETALTNFGVNSIPNGTPFAEIEAVLAPIYNFHRFQVEAAAKLLSGVNYSYSVKGEAAKGVSDTKVYSVVSAKEQSAALQALLSTLTPEVLTLPDHITALIPPKAYGYYRDRESFTSNTGITFDPVSAAQGSAKHTIALILNHQRLARLAQQHVMNEKIISVGSVINQLLNATVKQEAQVGMSLLVQQRVNQEVIEHLLKLWHNKSLVTEVRAEVYMTLNKLEEWLDDNNDSRKYKGLWAQFHLFERQIEHSLKQGELISPNSTIAMPPGSPIGSNSNFTH